jgi:hypothetical protein
MSRLQAAAIIVAIVLMAGSSASAQISTGGITVIPTEPAPNVTNWGVVERSGDKTHGKTGETIFIEGRDLDPDSLVVQATLGTRSAKMIRKAGGTASRVEFTIGPDALTANLTAKLTAFQQGSAAATLSSDYGICDRVRIDTIEPPTIGYDILNQTEAGNIRLTGKSVTFTGMCLQELRFRVVGIDQQFNVDGASVVVTPGPKQYNRVTMALSLLKLNGNGVTELFSGPIALTTPATGPTFSIGDTRNFNSVGSVAPAPAPVKLEAITISGAEGSGELWGPSPNFVIAKTDTAGPSWNSRVKIKGSNLAANTNTTWKIGALALTNVNTVFPPDVIATVPANAVTERICATRSDGQISCSPSPILVVPSPKISVTPTGWPKYGTVDEGTVLPIVLRQSYTISGFDLQPPAGATGLTATVTASNLNSSEAAACNFAFTLLAFDRNNIRFSFGQPGSSRPASCTEAQEQASGFMTTAPAQVDFKWIYNGTAVRVARWKFRGTN